ncbi:hypothetical protein [Tunturiibacter lichenicola]|uniref:hypothetical protein n=1 Tax=Tunturiibacter lichenicola TaxID=2051959 RepID=UPI0021B1B471|nr:hypothetical protein [Edaphobacter lichenicola]
MQHAQGSKRFIDEDASSLLEERGLSRFAFATSMFGALVFLYLRGFLLSGVPLVAVGDEDLFLGRAVHILHGSVMYRDFFELVTPGTDLFYAAVFRLFGVHAWVIQACGVAFGLAMFYVVTLIAAKIVRGPLVLLPGALFLVFDLSSAHDLTHHWFSTLAALVAVNVLMGGEGLVRVAWAGVFCALATLLTQTQGALVFIAMLLYLLWNRSSTGEARGTRVRLAAFVLPYAAVVAGVLGYYVYRAGLHVIYFDLVEFAPRFLTGDVNSPRTYLHQFPRIGSPGDAFRAIPYVFIYAVVPYVYFAGLYRLWRTPTETPQGRRRHLMLLHLVGLALFFSIVSGPRFFRLCTVAPPAILVSVWLCSEATRTMKMVRGVLWAAAVVFGAVLSLHRVTQWHAVLDLPIGRTAFVDQLQFHEFRWLAEHTQPHEPFFNKTALSLYLALDTPAIVEFINEDGFTRPEQVTAVLSWLEDRHARFIVMVPQDSGGGTSLSNSAPFRRYVQENYHLAQVFPLEEQGAPEELWERRAQKP